jgi:hypothetical protein
MPAALEKDCTGSLRMLNLVEFGAMTGPGRLRLDVQMTSANGGTQQQTDEAQARHSIGQ